MGEEKRISFYSSSIQSDSTCSTFLPAATKLGQGNIFTPVCDSVNRGGAGPGGLVCPGGGLPGGVVCLGGGLPGGSPIFWGGLQFSGGSPIFQGVSNFSGVSNFLGGLIQIFFNSNFFNSNFFLNSNFFSNFFPQKFLLGCTPPPWIRSLSGQYASYWNAFLLFMNVAFNSTRQQTPSSNQRAFDMLRMRCTTQ